ncbi:MAG: tetratricopeptide repeat protein [Deltaproteobacteria bacterium]|nr:tetratricopeptide repeat protein [Deltaproteobacteria bacterium]
MTLHENKNWLLTLTLALGLALPSVSYAQDEEEEEDDPFGDLEEDEDEGEGDGEESGDPNISREDDEDDVDDWSFEGETEKVEEVKKEEPKKKRELPAEPKRYGHSGNWYEVPVDCAECPDLLNQSFGIEESDVMREFFDFVQIDSDRKGGKFVFPSIGQNRPLGVKDATSRVLVWQYVIEDGTRLTDTYATLWDLGVHADDGVLYGRKYEIQAWTDDAYEDWEKGYKAKGAYIPENKLRSYFDLNPVKKLTLEKRNFQVGESSRVTFVGYSSFVRSDVSKEAIAKEQEALKAQAEENAKRLRDQKEWFRKGEDALDDRDWELALAAFLKSRKLGLDSLDLNYNLGFAYQKTKDYTKAITEYSTILETDPRDIDVRFNLAQIYEKQKDFDAAIKEYQTILKFDPDDDASRDRLSLLRAAREMIQD